MLIWAIVIASAAWVGFAYVGYPLVLMALARFSPRPVRQEAISPPISIIITVHNGAVELPSKLEATLALDYLGEKEVIVSSDGSTDETEAIVKAFEDRGVRLVSSSERGGKEAGQARAIATARGEILIFTDGRTQLADDALIELVKPFADPAVGSVSSEDDVDSDGGEGAYVRYEMALRRLETQATTLVGLSGSCFAVRRELADPWPTDLASDFRTALETASRGYRAVAQPSALATFGTVDDPAKEWERKVRTVRRGLAVLGHHRALLSPSHGRAAFSLWGHKVARFTSPFALIALLLASAWGATTSPVLALLCVLQVGAYVGGALSLVSKPVAAFFPLRIAGFFLLVNASMLQAWGHHLRGERAVVWTPTREHS